MAKCKWPQIESKLPLVEEWSKNGLTESQIAANLGISRSSLSAFKHRYPEFLDAINRGKAVAVTELENALFRRALGYDFEVTKVSIRVIDGREVKYTEKTKKHLPPDVAACFLLLKNKDRENWCDNPAKRDLEREIFEFNKKIEKAKLFGDDSQ